LARNTNLTLDRYATPFQQNRGYGFVHLFFADDAVDVNDSVKDDVGSSGGGKLDGGERARDGGDGGGGVGDDDLERRKWVLFTRSELLAAVVKGEFAEVKWTAAVALALLGDNNAVGDGSTEAALGKKH
jgi:hypothetical protein